MGVVISSWLINSAISNKALVTSSKHHRTDKLSKQCHDDMFSHTVAIVTSIDLTVKLKLALIKKTLFPSLFKNVTFLGWEVLLINMISIFCISCPL